MNEYAALAEPVMILTSFLHEPHTMLDTLKLSDFTNKINQSMPMSVGGQSVELTLIKAEAAPVRGIDVSELPRPPFSLLLAGGAPWAPQGTYTLSIPEIGDLSLFVVPVGPTADGEKMQYQVIFN